MLAPSSPPVIDLEAGRTCAPFVYFGVPSGSSDIDNTQGDTDLDGQGRSDTICSALPLHGDGEDKDSRNQTS